MNFLAHLYLSDHHEKIMIGNFIADFVKGKNALQAFEPDIISGILLHRAIDAFTDTHPVVSKSKNRLRPKYHHYAGVIVDVLYDHCLARNWSSYHPDTLPKFADYCYQTILSYREILPERAKQMLPYMVKQNWLLNYRSWDGIHASLSGMSRRTAYASHMDEAAEDLKADYPEYESEFNTFFPELVKMSKNFLSKPLT
jgi:acyl carrier protein phosphodiesterase